MKKEQVPPSEFYKGWDSLSELSFVDSIKIFDKNTVKVNKAITVQPDLNGNFSKEEIDYFEDIIFTLNNSRIYGTEGLVITPDNKVFDRINIIHDHIGHITNHEIFSRFKLPEVKEINGTVAVLTSLWPDFYYHWMVDILPKFHLLEKVGITPDWYVINGSGKKFQKFTLKKLGIPEEKIIWTHKNLHLKAEKIILPKIPGFTGHDPKWAIDYLRENFLDSSKTVNTPERIYISRNKAFSRRFVNNEEVEKILKKYGFEEIAIENYDVCEQAAIFNKAKAIFASHGGGLTNLVFSYTGMKVIEICSPLMPIPCYQAIANMQNLEYYHIMAEPQKGKLKKNGVKYTDQDIILDIEVLEKTLQLALD